MQLDSLASTPANVQVPLPRFLTAGAMGLHRTEVVGEAGQRLVCALRDRQG